MGSKSQRRSERQAKKLKGKQKRRTQLQARRRQIQQRTEIVVGSNARHRRRMAQQVPRAWAGEMAEDVAVFDDSALSTLTPDLASQVVAVRAALQEALESRGDEALKRLSVVSRGSPCSEWRLFVRGLVDWLADDSDAASEAWKRLETERRPGRIAAAMMASLRPDLEQISPLPEQQGLERQGRDEPGAASQVAAWSRLDSQQLYHAKLLRRVRIDRAALRIAETGLSVPEESQKLLLGPRKMQWLRQFMAEYGETEPELTAALAQTALGRAFAQNYSDLFDEAVRSFPGPKHDLRNRLLTFFYYHRVEDDPSEARTAQRALDDYLNRDLPQNEALSALLRGAIASQVHFNQAAVLMRPDRGGEVISPGMFDLIFGAPEDATKIRNHLLAAVIANPANGPVYQAHIDWIESKLDDDRLPKPERTRLEAELANVMQGWSQGVPEAVEPRLWLVDYFMENERLQEARPHVEFLAASRQDDPRVRAMPWKWQLLEAMRLCRRKAWLAEVPRRLDEAEALWPAWLPKQWLSYLRAAWALRNGLIEAFEEQRRLTCQEAGLVRDSLADACLMLGAAQQMRATATELKPFRAAVNRALAEINTLPFEALIETGSCFWDLHRAQMLYPAYRMHGKTIGKALCARLAKTTGLVLAGVALDGNQDERVPKAILWGSAYRFWPNNYETKFPPFLSNPAVQNQPLFVAARLNAFLKQRYRWDAAQFRELGPLLRAAAQGERDAYYRHWFVELADELDDVLASKSSRFSGFPFGDLFGGGREDDEDDSPGYDPYCNCPECQAAREAEKQGSSSKFEPY